MCRADSEFTLCQTLLVQTHILSSQWYLAECLKCALEVPYCEKRPVLEFGVASASHYSSHHCPGAMQSCGANGPTLSIVP